MSIAAPVATPVTLKKDAISYIAGKLKLSLTDTRLLIQNILQDTLDWTLLDMEEWIKEFVPKRTGQLQDNLLKNIQSSRVRDYAIKLIIRTSIDYAAEVNAMSDAQVQHDATWREHSGKKAYAYYYGHYGPIFLDDPNAIGSFMEELQKFSKERSFINLTKAKMRHMRAFYTTKGGTKYKEPIDKYLRF